MALTCSSVSARINVVTLPGRDSVQLTINGDWSLETEARYEKVDANKIKFLLPLKPHEKQRFSYEVTFIFAL